MRIINLLIYEKIYMVNMTNMFMIRIYFHIEFKIGRYIDIKCSMCGFKHRYKIPLLKRRKTDKIKLHCINCNRISNFKYIRRLKKK